MWESEAWPQHAQGVGLTEAPRGALAHFIVIENNKVKNYQMVVPTTWNASPRDEIGKLSAYESSLIGTPIHDPKQPLESSVLFTRLIPVWHVPYTCMTKRENMCIKWTRSKKQLNEKS